jgi:hypothetical protein
LLVETQFIMQKKKSNGTVATQSRLTFASPHHSIRITSNQAIGTKEAALVQISSIHNLKVLGGGMLLNL